jgi:membrane protein DedA with SNARE-associated domain
MLDKGEAYFDHHGGKSVFLGRFIPGIKSVVPGIAGIVGMSPWRFTVINIVSAVVWAAVHLLPCILLAVAPRGTVAWPGHIGVGATTDAASSAVTSIAGKRK